MRDSLVIMKVDDGELCYYYKNHRKRREHKHSDINSSGVQGMRVQVTSLSIRVKQKRR